MLYYKGRVGKYYKRRHVWFKHPTLGWREGVIIDRFPATFSGRIWVKLKVLWADGKVEMIATMPGKDVRLKKPRDYKGPAARSAFLPDVADEEGYHFYSGPKKRGPRSRR